MKRCSCEMLVALLMLLCAADVALAGPTAWLGVALSATGQKSLLDGAEEEEAPLGKPPAAKAAENPAAPAGPGASSKSPAAEDGEEPPLAAAPSVTTGGGSLDDLLASDDEAAKKGEAVISEPTCDVVVCGLGKGISRARYIKYLPTTLLPPFARGETYEFTEVGESGVAKFVIRPKGEQIDRIEYYEQRMLRRAADEFGASVEQFTGPITFFDLSGPRRATAAGRSAALLQTALAEHDSAVQRYLRQGPGWSNLREPLAQALLNLQVSQSRMLFQTGKYDQAVAACDRLLEQTKLNRVVSTAIRNCLEEMMIGPAERAFAGEDYATSRKYLADYLQRFPSDPGDKASSLRKRMVEAAQALADRGRAEKDPNLIDRAAAVWPTLNGLDQMRNGIITDYPVLNCAYTTLPRHFSPLAATTPVERHAMSLMFESLVRWTDDPKSGPRYLPQLAEHRPVPLARGRQFQLPRCQWSDSEYESPHLCTAEDVVWTVQLLKKVRPHGFPIAWEQLVRVDTTKTADNPFQFDILLGRDHWQPLSLMDFMVLPRSSFPKGGDGAELARFDEQPVGTGPFRLLSRNAREVRFTANPLYRKPNLPRIREIRFHQLDAIEGADAFRKGQVHMLHGARPTHVDELSRQGKKVIKMDARSVYFLAPNYDVKALQNRELRMAIAHAIERESILTNYFRPAQGGRDHAALNGPYLANTWAYNPKTPSFSPSQARTFLAQASQALGGPPPKLRLAYPDRDPDIGSACGEIKRQLGGIGIEIELVPIDPNEFHDQIVKRRLFDLVYWRHDFDDETYWIWPLFDPGDVAEGGSNFMHVTPDKALDDLFHEMMIHKQFVKIQAAAHKTHDYIARNACIIPLWQLNTYVAMSSSVSGPTEGLDPIYLFQNVQDWVVKPDQK